MRIMYLTDVGFDTPNSNNRLVLSMLEEFLKNGHYVYLVQSHSTGQCDDIPISLEKYQNFKCDTVNKSAVKKTNFILRYLNGMKYEFNAKKYWNKNIGDIDVVLLQSHFTSWFAAWLLRNVKAKIVFNIYDIFPGEAYTNGNIKCKFIYNCLCLLQKYLYNNCDYFFVLSEDMKSTLISLGVNENKISVTPVWFEESNIHNVRFEDNKFALKYNLSQNKKYIQYAGSIGVAYDFDFVIDLAKQLEYRKDIVFQIVGDGVKLEELKNKCYDLKIENITFIPWQPLELLSDVYSSCSLEIIPLMKEVINNSYPSKILPVMACSRIPVISVEKNSYFYKEINDNKIGFTSPIGDVKKMAENIIYLIDNPKILNDYEKKAHSYVYENYKVETSVKKMIEVLIKKFGL